MVMHSSTGIQDLLYALHALLLPVFLVFLVLLALTPVVYLKRNRIRKWCNAKTVNDESRTKTGKIPFPIVVGNIIL